MAQHVPSDFEKAAQSSAGHGIVSEFWDFLRANKKWWLLPMLLIILGLGLLTMLSSSAAAPFVYTLF